MQKRAVITGASSGIGYELAKELSRRGYALALLARRADLLEQLAAELNLAGGRAVPIACDVADRESVGEAVRRSTEQLGGPLDLAVANAGVGTPIYATDFRMDDAEQIIRVNVLGMMYLFEATVPAMVERRSGRFAAVASVAGHRGLPTASVYSASKSAMQSFLDAVRVELHHHGVGVTTINPGFVATPMTAKNRFRMPFLMDAPRAARIIADGIERGRAIVEFPFGTSMMMRIARLLPTAIFDRVMRPAAHYKKGKP
jgi:short-subunit dehydrogenase